MLVTKLSQTNVDQNQISLVYYTRYDPLLQTYTLDVELMSSIEQLNTNVLDYVDVTIAVEFRQNSESTFKDVAGCKMRLNQVKNKIENIKAVDFYTRGSAYDELLNLPEDNTTSGQDWHLTTVGVFNDETEFYCQSTHCYITCNLERKVHPTMEIAASLTNTEEDQLYYQGA
mmetsp:Transcript_1794/g.2547  ORF Transcript_1794/g.2547 Transcript_1794/m.2547 type:complete len:172 (+) Transcript_1794:87-602(+)